MTQDLEGEGMLFKHDLEVMLIHKFSNFVDSWKKMNIYLSLMTCLRTNRSIDWIKE